MSTSAAGIAQEIVEQAWHRLARRTAFPPCARIGHRPGDVSWSVADCSRRTTRGPRLRQVPRPPDVPRSTTAAAHCRLRWPASSTRKIRRNTSTRRRPRCSKGRELYGPVAGAPDNQKLDRLIVVEGYMDVVALAQYGVSQVGRRWAPRPRPTMPSCCSATRRTFFCFDGDRATQQRREGAGIGYCPRMKDGRQAVVPVPARRRGPGIRAGAAGGGRERLRRAPARRHPVVRILLPPRCRAT